ncbi:hypothetical protein QAD02_019052 [Eretmocerus hayati]|uniref:Uncharacterized protein n=1 Tax=Eretmocerus hayati TaxID=131215 RepID=A0ACC2PI43_9HYME|nr:hypothetical protein QAD02_019052 [Eretmocerus hayati]
MNIVLVHRKSVFIFGFIIGFLSFILIDYFYSISKSSKNAQKTSLFVGPADKISYVAWKSQQYIKDSKVDLDTLVYGKQSGQKEGESRSMLEAEWLKKKIPITCVAFVERLKLAAAIKATWGKHCNKLVLFSQRPIDDTTTVITLNINYTSSWHLLCETMNYLWKKKKELPLSWTIFVKDDTIVIPENLRHVLAPLDPMEPHYLGHAIVLWSIPYNAAEAGYVLSYKVLQKLMSVFDNSQKCIAGGKYWKKEDFYLGKHLASMGIYPTDTRDAQLRTTFHGFSMNALLGGIARPASYHSRTLYPPASGCCSDRTITFNIGDADRMRTLSYILFHLRIFRNGTHGNRPPPTPIPDNEVWKVALREEFNLTDISDISNEQYFQIWRSKYSDPEYFIAKNYHTKSKLKLDSES